jgi:hypothetical protein
MMEGVNSIMIYLIYCKNFCVNATMYPQHNNKNLKRENDSSKPSMVVHEYNPSTQDAEAGRYWS